MIKIAHVIYFLIEKKIYIFTRKNPYYQGRILLNYFFGRKLTLFRKILIILETLVNMSYYLLIHKILKFKIYYINTYQFAGSCIMGLLN